MKRHVASRTTRACVVSAHINLPEWCLFKRPKWRCEPPFTEPSFNPYKHVRRFFSHLAITHSTLRIIRSVCLLVLFRERIGKMPGRVRNRDRFIKRFIYVFIARAVKSRSQDILLKRTASWVWLKSEKYCINRKVWFEQPNKFPNVSKFRVNILRCE